MKWIPWILVAAVGCVYLYGVVKAELNGGEYMVRIGRLELHFKRKDLP